MTANAELSLRMALIENQLAFLGAHRGRIEKDGRSWRCVSDKADFTFAILTNAECFSSKLVQDGTLYVPSWLSEPMPSELSAGRRLSHALGYMHCDVSGLANGPTESIRRATDLAGIEDFSETQARGFCEDETDYTEWAPWMRAANLRNFENPHQDFFVDYEGPSPAACALSIYDNSIAGIYAVATIPRYRRQGRATSLLRHAAAAAREKGLSQLGLQTVVGSVAETLYRGQGFRTVFEMQIWVRR